MTKNGPTSSAPRPASKRSESPTVSAPPVVSRADWQLFCSLDTLPQKAGVPARDLPKLVAKELADNALDAAGGRDTGGL